MSGFIDVDEQRTGVGAIERTDGVTGLGHGSYDFMLSAVLIVMRLCVAG